MNELAFDVNLWFLQRNLLLQKKKIKVKIWRANDRMLCDILKGTYMRLIYT